MPENQRKSQAGQTLVMVAMLMVVLLAFAALAIGFGRIYLERRFLQNAADAGALAGARAMCFDGLTYEEAIASGGPAETFALKNVPHPEDTLVEYPTPPNGWTVVVTARENALPTFMGPIVGMDTVVGTDTVMVGATAAAACGPAVTVCGLWPIAFPRDEYYELEQVPNTNPPQCRPREFYVWNGDNDEHPQGSGGRLDCDVFQCDLPDENGIRDGIPEIIAGEGRAWLDFSEVVIDDPLYPDNNCSQNGCGAAEIACWIRKSSPAQLTIPACIGGDYGQRVAIRNPVEDRVEVGDSVSLPLYDSAGCDAPTNCSDSFRIVALGCIKPLAWEKLKVYYKDENHNPEFGWFQMIYARIDCDPAACDTSCGSIPGNGPCPPGTVCAVNLIE